MKRTYPAVILVLALIGFLPAIGRTQETLFSGRAYLTSAEPGSVTAADVNGDGKPDIVTANYASNSVSVLLGNGNGTFAAKTDYAVGNAPNSVVIADVNGDGKPDIVTSNGTFNVAGSVSVLLNNGDGTFAAHTNYATGGGAAYTVAVADVNGDGKPDIVTCHYDYLSVVSVLLNKGGGTFAPATNYPAGNYPNAVAIADVNGDGKPDIITTNIGTLVYSGGGGRYVNPTLVILNGNGDGTFAPQINLALNFSPIHLLIADVNGDGKPDLITLTSGTLGVLLGYGNNRFATETDYTISNRGDTLTNGNAAAVGDINGDGKLDIVIANPNSHVVSVLPGIGDGTFAAKTDYAFGSFPAAVAIADVNGDGKPDIIVADENSSVVGVLFGSGNGSFRVKPDYTVGYRPYSVVMADVNGDGKPDIITANQSGNAYGSVYGNVSVLLGDGHGAFAAHTDYTVGSGPQSVAVVDINGDGKPDIVTANSGDLNIYTGHYNGNTVSVLLNKGDGTFAAKTDFVVGSGVGFVAVADVNGDGNPDIIAANENDNTVSVLLGDGHGAFAAYTDYAVGYGFQAVAVADINGDGKPDIVTVNRAANTISVLLNKGNGSFAPTAAYAVGKGVYAVTVADVNGDGKPDIITTNYSAKTISILLGMGSGVFAAKTDYAVSIPPSSVAVADVNGDGKIDIITAYSYGATVSVLLGNGAGAFAAETDYAVGPSAFSVAVGDVNGDGKPDIVTANYNGKSVSILLNIAERSRVSGLLALEGIVASASAQPVTFDFRSPGFPDFAPTLGVAPNGAFAVNLPKRNGVLHIKGSKYLAANVNVDATGGNVSGVTAILPAGDGNNDNIVDIADFGLLVNAYNSDISIAGSGYDTRADFNGDGMVDIADFGLLVNNYNRQGHL